MNEDDAADDDVRVRDDSHSPPPLPDGPSPGPHISEEETRMAVALTEYFHEQRKVFEQVSQQSFVYYFTLQLCIMFRYVHEGEVD